MRFALNPLLKLPLPHLLESCLVDSYIEGFIPERKSEVSRHSRVWPIHGGILLQDLVVCNGGFASTTLQFGTDRRIRDAQAEFIYDGAKADWSWLGRVGLHV